MKARTAAEVEGRSETAVARRRALAVGVPEGLLSGPGLRAAFEVRSGSLDDAATALATGDVEAILVDGYQAPEPLSRFLEQAGETLRPGRPVILVLAQEARRTNVVAELIDHVDDFVLADRGEEAFLARLRNALRSRGVVDELQRKNADLQQAQERAEALARRMSEELRLAAHLQRSLLPPPLQHQRFDLAREFLPVREIGGDFFDLVPLGGDRFGLALGDVMGKGVPAALLTGTLKAGLRAQLALGDATPCELVARVNRLFWEVTPKGLFATLFFAMLDLGAGRLDYVNAGHDHPFVVREGGRIDDLDRGGTVLGLLEAARYERAQVSLERGDMLVLYTDGVTDRTGLRDEPFGLERLKAAAVRSRRDTARIALYSMLGEVQGWADGASPHDDMTLVVARML
ncbi:MAG TPA: PP2C family protein-serine/threonine phosphatase [Vicinamibacteria bacterium]|nr:PP2C family protein-serine/threonine phosphatase [Vicinamibacteria bacterium]